MRQSADCQIRPGETESPTEDGAQQQVHTLGGPQRRLDKTADERDDPEEHDERPRGLDVSDEQCAEGQPGTAGERHAEHSWGAVVPTVRAVLTHGPQGPDRHQRAVRALPGDQPYHQGCCQTHGRASGESRLRGELPVSRSRGDVVHAERITAHPRHVLEISSPIATTTRLTPRVLSLGALPRP
jgi:hypothetical protein